MKERVKKLGDIASYLNGYAFKPKDWKSEGIPIIRIQNLNNENANYNYYQGIIDEKYKIEKGDVLIAWSASLGVYEWNFDIAYLNQHIFKVVFDKIEINKSYFKFLIVMKLDEIIHNTHGSSMKHITKKRFESITVNLHPLPIQHQIVAELDALNTIMDKKRAQLEELDKLAQATFYHMFGDPIYNEKGWEVKKFDSFSNVKSSRRVFIKDCVEEGIPFYRGTEIAVLSKGKSVTSKLYISLEHYERLKEDTGIPKIGDLLLPSICSDGEVWRVDSNEPFYFKDGRVIWVELLDKSIDSRFLQFSFSQMLKSNFSNIASGTTFKEMKIFLLKALEIPIPPNSLQTQFTQKVKHIENQKALIERSIADVQQLFDYTMDRYFS